MPFLLCTPLHRVNYHTTWSKPHFACHSPLRLPPNTLSNCQWIIPIYPMDLCVTTSTTTPVVTLPISPSFSLRNLCTFLYPVYSPESNAAPLPHREILLPRPDLSSSPHPPNGGRCLEICAGSCIRLITLSNTQPRLPLHSTSKSGPVKAIPAIRPASPFPGPDRDNWLEASPTRRPAALSEEPGADRRRSCRRLLVGEPPPPRKANGDRGFSPITPLPEPRLPLPLTFTRCGGGANA